VIEGRRKPIRSSDMPLADAKNPRDPLSTLRISRSHSQQRSSSARRWIRKLVILGGILLAFAAVVLAVHAMGLLDVMDSLQPRPEVRVASVSVQTGRAADATVVATGYLESRRQAKIGARAPGRIELLKVEEGSRVKKGEMLAALEHADLDASLAANQAQLEQARAQVEEQKVLITRTKREYDRDLKLEAPRAISQTQLDVAKFEHEAAVARIGTLKAAVSLAEARVHEAEQMRENMFVRAPFDGTVISKDAEVGESIMPGGMGESSGRGSVITIADLAQLEVDCDVKEDYISRVSAGRPAEIAVDAVPGRRYKGKVRKVIPMGDRARATIKVKVSVVDADERLFPEMSATVYFLPDAKEDVPVATAPRIFCPADAIVQVGSSPHVWIVQEDERLKRTDVKTGAKNDSRIEILSGLSGGEQVVVKPVAELHEGQRVKVAE
jgi:RND family efflux transporter MFP subunit